MCYVVAVVCQVCCWDDGSHSSIVTIFSCPRADSESSLLSGIYWAEWDEYNIHFGGYTFSE